MRYYWCHSLSVYQWLVHGHALSSFGSCQQHRLLWRRKTRTKQHVLAIDRWTLNFIGSSFCWMIIKRSLGVHLPGYGISQRRRSQQRNLSAQKSHSKEVSQQRRCRTKASFPQVEAAVFEGSLALKLRFHIFNCQFLREVLHGMRV